MRTSYCPEISHLAPCIDGRTRLAKRFRSLARSFASEVGGDLTPSQVAMVRQAAALTLQAEQMQDAVISGASIDPDEIVRVSSEARRMLAALGAPARGEHPLSFGLTEYLQQKARSA